MQDRVTGDVGRGACAGLIATLPMTGFMLTAHRALPENERYALPPEQITDVVLKRVGVEAPPIGGPRHMLATGAAHFAYGAIAGGLYGGAFGRKAGPVSGVLYGLSVWAGSYLGLLPSQNILKPATQHPWRRNVLMIAAHVVWGATTGTTLHMLKNAARQKRQRA